MAIAGGYLFTSSFSLIKVRIVALTSLDVNDFYYSRDDLEVHRFYCNDTVKLKESWKFFAEIITIFKPVFKVDPILHYVMT